MFWCSIPDEWEMLWKCKQRIQVEELEFLVSDLLYTEISVGTSPELLSPPNFFFFFFFTNRMIRYAIVVVGIRFDCGESNPGN